MKSILALGCLATAGFLGLEAIETDTNTLAGGAAVGTLTWDGDRPEPLPAKTIVADKAVGCCAEGESVDDTNRALLISEEGGIANVVVTFERKDGEIEHEAREEPLLIDHSKCRFEPHVLVARVGDKVRYLNSDEVNHNVHTTSKKNPAFNNNVAAGKYEERDLKFAETITVVCDIHPWMDAYVYVTYADYFGTSGPDGVVRVEGMEPGTYKVEYWHEKLGKGKLDDVVVSADGVAEFSKELKEDGGGGRGRRRGR